MHISTESEARASRGRREDLRGPLVPFQYQDHRRRLSMTRELRSIGLGHQKSPHPRLYVLERGLNKICEFRTSLELEIHIITDCLCGISLDIA